MKIKKAKRNVDLSRLIAFAIDKAGNGEPTEQPAAESAEPIQESETSDFDPSVFASLTSFRAREQYCNANFVRVGSGSSRVVFKINPTTVIKLAKNNAGIEQNIAEDDEWLQEKFASILPIVKSGDDDGLWVVVEFAEKLQKPKFETVVGLKWEKFATFIDSYRRELIGEKGFRPPFTSQEYDELFNNDFISAVIKFADDAGRELGDFTRLSSFGLVHRDGSETVVIVDYGLTFSVHKDFYSPKKALAEGETLLDQHHKVYIGGELGQLKHQAKNFSAQLPAKSAKIPEDRTIGVVAFEDKAVAMNHSKQHECNFVLPLYISPKAKIYRINTNGEGISTKISNAQLVELAKKGYDAVIDVSNQGNTEIRILRSNKIYTELELNA